MAFTHKKKGDKVPFYGGQDPDPDPQHWFNLRASWHRTQILCFPEMKYLTSFTYFDF
jgi:hypothetical protein